MDNDKIFPSTKYKKHTHLFDFHSWAPLYINIQNIELGLGASVMSQNLLSSSVLEAGFMYNIHDKNKLFAHYTYSGFYPIFEATINYRPRNINRDLDSNIVPYLNWNEINFEQKITLPFTWVNRNMYNKIDLAFYYTLNNITNADHLQDKLHTILLDIRLHSLIILLWPKTICFLAGDSSQISNGLTP